MSSPDEYRDPVIRDLFAKQQPPEHGASFWDDLDGALADEAAPASNMQVSTPGGVVSDDAPSLAPVPTSTIGQAAAAPGTAGAAVIELDSRRSRTRVLAGVAAALLIVVGLAAVLLRNDSGVDVQQAGPSSGSGEPPAVDSAGSAPDQAGEDSSALNPATEVVLSEANVGTLDGRSEYYVSTLKVDEDLPCPPRQLVAGALGANRADVVFDGEFAGSLRVFRSLDDRLVVVETCKGSGRIISGVDAPEGGFQADPTVTPISADFDLDLPLLFDVVLGTTDGTMAVNPHTGEVARLADCSGVGIRAKRLRGDIPQAAAQTRLRILEAARVCDYGQLADLIGPTFASDGADPIAQWQDAEAAGEDIMASLVGALNTTAVFILDPAPDSEDELYSWPQAIIHGCDDLPDNLRSELFDELGYTQVDLDEDCERIGAYAGYRLAIDPDGAWRYFTRRSR